MAKIEKFADIIKDHIGPKKTIVDTTITNLTAPGENYMSELLKIDVILKNNDSGKKEDLHCVAKTATENPGMAPTSKLIEDELIFYRDVIPAIKSFHERHGLPYPQFYPDFLGGRINLTGTKEADTDAVLVLENLKAQGYENVDRHIGFNLETAKLVLDDLATFHAVPLAMKLLEPQIYETEIKAKLMAFQKGPPMKADNGPPGPKGHPGPPGPTARFLPAAFGLVLQKLKQEEQYSQAALKYENYLKNLEDIRKTKQGGEMLSKTPMEPYVTLAQWDTWINNSMQVFKDGVAIKNKFVDFQTCRIASPADDVIFFLFSSVEMSCLKDNLDNLIKHYHETFANVLKKLSCYGPQFSYDTFLEEIKRDPHGVIAHSMFKLPNVVFFKKGEKFANNEVGTMTLEDISPLALEKLVLLCLEATKRGWI